MARASEGDTFHGCDSGIFIASCHCTGRRQATNLQKQEATQPMSSKDAGAQAGDDRYPPFFSSARTSLATSRSVSNTPWPLIATASVTGSPLI
jgi:hypothetical protein